MDGDAADLAAARAAKSRAKTLLQDLPQVCGIGITQIDKRYAVKVNLEGDANLLHPIPQDIDGVPVVVHKTGKIRKLESPS